MIRPEPGELQELVRELHRQGTPWLPAGLASRLDWGAPVAPCTVVSCGALSGIREHSPGDFTVTVGAGTPLEELQEALAPHRQWLAIDPPFATGSSAVPGLGSGQPTAPGQGHGSIGGLVARGLAGGYRERYLGVRDQLIGLRLLRAVPGHGQRKKLGLLDQREFDAAAQCQACLTGRGSASAALANLDSL